MRSNRSRFALLGVLALALGVFAGPGVAQAAKVSESSVGGLVPDAVANGGQITNGTITQEFKFSGKNVKQKQTLSVNVTVNATGSAAGANGPLSGLLIGPKGDNDALGIPFQGQSLSNLELDQQSFLVPCNPATQIAPNCNYLSGGDAAGNTGTFIGELSDSLDQEFKGVNPKGTWKIIWQDGAADGITSTLGEITVELKTGKKFAKEDK